MKRFVGAFLLLSIPFAGYAGQLPTDKLMVVNDECQFIRDQIAGFTEAGGIVEIPEGTFNCKAAIVIKKNNVTLKGKGEKKTILRLADQSPAPLLVIGNDIVAQNPKTKEWNPITHTSNIEVSDLSVDGNLPNMPDPRQNECGNHHCDGDVQSIRNNAITIRGSSNVRISRVTAHHAISGGLVTEKYCWNLRVTDFTSHSNFFDGLAGYQTKDSVFERVNLSRNRSAGISIDIDFNKNTFRDAILENNGDVGIFQRHSDGNLFERVKIIGSGNHGAYLAQDGKMEHTCADNNEFRSVTINGSKGFGFFLQSPCVGNKITGVSTMIGNGDVNAQKLGAEACIRDNNGPVAPAAFACNFEGDALKGKVLVCGTLTCK